MVYIGYLIYRNGKVPYLRDDLLRVVGKDSTHAISHVPPCNNIPMLFWIVKDLDLLEEISIGLIIRQWTSLGEDSEEKAELDQLTLPLFHKLASNLHCNRVSNLCKILVLISHMLISCQEEVVAFFHALEVRQGLTSPNMLLEAIQLGS